MLTRQRVSDLLAGFSNVKVLVIGDLMLDRYVFGSVTRISPEAPVPVVHVTHEESRPGGASNVALNVASLGGQSTVAGAIGADRAGHELMQTLETAGIKASGVLTSETLQTTVKTRVVAERQQVVRVDRESSAEHFENGVSELCDRLPEWVAAADAVVIEDYGKGIICQAVVDVVLDAARDAGVLVGFDPKDNHRLRLPWLTLATPNYREACLAAGVPETALVKPLESESLLTAGRTLAARWQTELLMITLGPHGMYLQGRSEAPLVLPTVAREVFDVSGAGDTVIATALTAMAAGATHAEAAELANHAAGVVVGKLGTAVCSADELLHSFMSSPGGTP